MAHAKKRHTVRKPWSSTSVTTDSFSSDSEDYEQNSRMLCSSPYRSDSCLSTSSIESRNIKSRPCHSGIKCFNVDCRFDHPDGWNPCKYGVRCKNYYCMGNHPFERRAKCRDDAQCKTSDCKFLHPNTRSKECPFGTMCKKWDCLNLHPYSRVGPCNYTENCTNLACALLHPTEHAELLCPIEADYPDLTCKLDPPLERIINLQEKTATNHNPLQFVALFCVLFFLFSSFSMYHFNIVSIFSLPMYYIFFSLMFFFFR